MRYNRVRFEDLPKSLTRDQKKEERVQFDKYIRQVRQEYNQLYTECIREQRADKKKQRAAEREQLKQQGSSTRVGQRRQGIGRLFPFQNDVFSNTREYTLGDVFPFSEELFPLRFIEVQAVSRRLARRYNTHTNTYKIVIKNVPDIPRIDLVTQALDEMVMLKKKQTTDKMIK